MAGALVGRGRTLKLVVAEAMGLLQREERNGRERWETGKKEVEAERLKLKR